MGRASPPLTGQPMGRHGARGKINANRVLSHLIVEEELRMILVNSPQDLQGPEPNPSGVCLHLPAE